MKTNDWLLAAATATFSYLFYNQNAGINFLLFNFAIIGILLIRDRDLLRKREWLLAAAMCLLSATGILLHSSALAVFANICSLLLLSAFAYGTNSSFIFSFLFSLYSVATALVQMLIDASTRSLRAQDKKKDGQKGYKLLVAAVTLVLGIVFFVLYRNANPLFASNTHWISFDTISVPWLFFTAFGFMVVYGLFYHKTIAIVEAWELAIPLHSQPASPDRKDQHAAERWAGIFLFALLNLMLVVLNAGDIHTLWLTGELPAGMSHSDFVHEGVALIIVSILIAVGLIVFLYRNHDQVSKAPDALRLLVYAWIAQNLVMLLSIALRNNIYVRDYNLTYLRIGVYVWLCLAVIGLVVTFVKVQKQRSAWYLLRTNVAVWFCTLALSSLVNWDLRITRYNLANKPISQVDFYYLFDLSDSNIPELMAVTSHPEFRLVDLRLQAEHGQSYRNLMKQKAGHFLFNHHSSWQSWDAGNARIVQSLINH